MQFWIGLLIGAMIGASVGLLVLAWLNAARRADDLSERGTAARSEPRGGRFRVPQPRVLELPRSVPLTTSDADTLRIAADALEARGNNDEARRLRDIADRAEPHEEARPVRRG